MRAIMLTAVVAGSVGLSAGVWLKSTVLASAATMQMQPVTISPEELMRAVPKDLPITEVVDLI